LRRRSAESIDKMRRSLGSFIKSVCNNAAKSQQQWKWVEITDALVRDRLE